MSTSSFPIGSNIYVKHVTLSGEEIHHAAKVVGEAVGTSIIVQWIPQRTKECVDVVKCLLMDNIPRRRNRRKNTPKSARNHAAFTVKRNNMDESYRRRWKAWNHAAYAGQGKSNVRDDSEEEEDRGKLCMFLSCFYIRVLTFHGIGFVFLSSYMYC